MALSHMATVASVRQVNAALALVALEVPRDVVEAFHAPGQYHRLSVDEVIESPFAIASGPRVGPFEYLVRRTGGVSDALADASTGQRVHASMPEGTGFSYDAMRRRDLVLVGTGTGFAPLRSVLKLVQSDRTSFGAVTAIYGVRNPTELAFEPEFAAWKAAGIEVHPTVSNATTAWQGRTGRVQGVLEDIEVAGAVVLLCGQQAMVDEVRALLAARGVAAGDVLHV